MTVRRMRSHNVNVQVLCFFQIKRYQLVRSENTVRHLGSIYTLRPYSFSNEVNLPKHIPRITLFHNSNYSPNLSDFTDRRSYYFLQLIYTCIYTFLFEYYRYVFGYSLGMEKLFNVFSTHVMIVCSVCLV